MSDIVQASGLSKGAVYFYFDSKESLAVAVLASRQEKWISGVAQILDAAQPGLPRLRALLPAMLTLLRHWDIAAGTPPAVAAPADLRGP